MEWRDKIMQKLVINKIDNYNYELQDKDDNIYNINMEFYDLEKTVQVGDVLYMDEDLLKEKILNFGSLNNECGKVITDSSDKDIIVLVINNEKNYLKRIYG